MEEHLREILCTEKQTASSRRKTSTKRASTWCLPRFRSILISLSKTRQITILQSTYYYRGQPLDSRFDKFTSPNHFIKNSIGGLEESVDISDLIIYSTQQYSVRRKRRKLTAR